MKSLIGPCVWLSWSRYLVVSSALSPTSRPTIVTGHPAWKDDLRGFGIVVDVGFGGSVDVAAGDRAAHEDDFLHERNDGWIFFDRERNVGERADGHERDFVR